MGRGKGERKARIEDKNLFSEVAGKHVKAQLHWSTTLKATALSSIIFCDDGIVS